MDLPITAASVIVLGLWLVILSWRVIGARQEGAEKEGGRAAEMLNRRIRGQANFTEYAPFAVLLILVAELQGANFTALAITSAVFIIGRLLHGMAFGFMAHWVIGRVGGIFLTLIGLLLLVILNLWALLTMP